MKSVITAVILIVVVLWGGAAYTSKLTEVSMELVKINEEVQHMLEKEDFDGATEKINEMSEYLDKREPVLAAVGNHQEIDTMRMNIAELYRYSSGEMLTDALAKSAALEFLYLHLPKNYRLRLENVL